MEDALTNVTDKSLQEERRTNDSTASCTVNTTFLVNEVQFNRDKIERRFHGLCHQPKFVTLLEVSKGCKVIASLLVVCILGSDALIPSTCTVIFVLTSDLEEQKGLYEIPLHCRVLMLIGLLYLGNRLLLEAFLLG